MAIRKKEGEISHFKDLEVDRATHGILLEGFAGAAGCEDDTVDAAPMVPEEGSTHDGVPSYATLAFPLAAALSFRFRSFLKRFRSSSSTSPTATFVSPFSLVTVPSTARTKPPGTTETLMP